MQHLGIKKSILILFIASYLNNVHGTDPPGKEDIDGIEPSTSTDILRETEPRKRANYIINLKISHYSSQNSGDFLYHFYIQPEHWIVLTQPNKIEYIKFNGDLLPFDYGVKLPNTHLWSFISIYSHKCIAPLLLQIILPKRRYYYSPDPETGRWINQSIDSLKGFEEVDDEGIIYYKLEYDSYVREFQEKIYKTYLELLEKFANYDKETGNDTIAKDPTLEINIELTELLCKPPRFSQFKKGIENKRPKLELSSFTGEGNVRIQTYTLDVKDTVARAVLVHGYRNHFQSEFLNYNPKYFDNLTDPGLEQYKQYHMDAIERNIKLKYKYGVDLVSAEELKSMVCGKLKLEDVTVDVYKDGTDGWATTDRYVYEESFAQALNMNGISVHGLDLRSFGASQSPKICGAGRVRGMIDDFDYMAKDLITFIKIVKEKYNDGLPIVLIGVSMGGTAVARALEISGKKKRLADGAILIAATIKCYKGIFDTIDKHARWLLKAVVFFAPKKEGGTGERAWKTDYKSLLKTDDPYCPNTYIYIRTGFNIIKGANDSLRYIKRINRDTALMIIHSNTDELSLFEGTEKFYNSLTEVKRKNFVRLRNLRHLETTSLRYFTPLSKLITQWIKDVNKDYKFDNIVSEFSP